METRTTAVTTPGELGALPITHVVGPTVPPPANPPLMKILEARARGDHSCVLLTLTDAGTTGQVKCWGWNAYGQLGLGNTANRGDNGGELGDFLPYAMATPSGETVRNVHTGSGSTCAMSHPAKTVRCWGFGTTGELGLGHTNHMGDHANELPTASIHLE